MVTTSETTTPRSGIYIILQGRRSLVHTFPRRARASDPTPQRIHNDDIFLSKEQELFDPNTRERIKKITAGEMILPYTFELPGTISESIAGLGPNFVEYNLKAYLEKKMLSKKVCQDQPLSIFSLIAFSCYPLTHLLCRLKHESIFASFERLVPQPVRNWSTVRKPLAAGTANARTSLGPLPGPQFGATTSPSISS